MRARQWLLDRIVILMENSGYSARSLSIAIDRNPDYIYKVKAGKLFFSVADLEKITELCGSSLEELFYEKYERYKIDKKILEKIATVDSKVSDALTTLLAVLYEEQKIEKKDSNNV